MNNTGIEYPARGEMAFYDLGEPPDPGPTEIVIRTHYSGLTNGTERHSMMGEHGWDGSFPSRNGYQHVGRVEAVGSTVQDFTVGDWVFYGHYVGHRGWHVQDVSLPDGGHLCQKLPGTADRKLCALLGVAGVAMRGVRRFRIAPGQRVWVAGQGPIGHFAAQAARAMGAEVAVSEKITNRLDAARECGVDRVIDANDTDSWKVIEAGAPYDCIIDACGVDSFLLDIYEHNLLAHAGVAGVLAVHSLTTFHWSMLHGCEASIEVSCHFSLDDLRVLLGFIEQDVIRIAPMVSHCLPIEEAPALYATLRDTPNELLGVIFDWTGNGM